MKCGKKNDDKKYLWDKLDIKLVSTIDEALELALVRKPDAIDWDEDAWLAEQRKISENNPNFTAH